MRVGVGPVRSLIVESSATAEEMKAARIILSCSDPDAWRRAKYRRGPAPNTKINSRVSFLDKNWFPTGLLARLVKGMKKAGHEVTVTVDKTKQLPHTDPTHDMFLDGDDRITLDAEQIECIKTCLRERRGIVKAVTGWGKTEVLLGIYQCLQPVRALLLVSRKGLRAQALARAIKRLGRKDIHVLTSEHTDLPDTGLVITTFHMLYGRLFDKIRKHTQIVDGVKRTSRKVHKAHPGVKEWIKGVDLVLCDEAHRLPCKQYKMCVRAAPASYRIGVSATPIVGNPVRNMTVRGALGEIIFSAEASGQVEKGRIARVHVFFKPIGQEDPIGMIQEPGEEPISAPYDYIYKHSLEKYKPFHDQILEDVRWYYENDLPVLILVDWARVGKVILKRLQAELPSEEIGYLDGELSEKVYQARKEAFFQEKLKVLIATPVFGEGEDLPNIYGMILACAGKAPHALIQKVGRAARGKVRLDDNRPNLVYVRHYVNCRHPFFLKHFKKNLATYRRMPYITTHDTKPLTLLDE